MKVNVLTTTESFSQLHSLGLGGNFIGPDGAQTLAQCGHLRNLTFLGIGANAIGNSGLSAIANSPYFSNLKTLMRWGNRIQGHGIQPLVESEYMQHLTELDLSDNDLDDQGMNCIATVVSWKLTRLTLLDLGRIQRLLKKKMYHFWMVNSERDSENKTAPLKPSQKSLSFLFLGPPV